jgi:hypothetical protein
MKELLEAIRTFSVQQWLVVFAIIGCGYSGYNWVENRYAKRDTAEMALDHLIRIDGKISAIITTQYTPEQAALIEKNAKMYEEQMRRYRESKKK